MKVKLKVKHLIYTILLVLTLTIGITQWLIPEIKITMAEGDSINNEEIIELLEEGNLPNYKKIELVEEHLISYGFDHRYDIYAGPGSVQGPSLPFNSTAIEYVEWYVEHSMDKSKSGYFYRAINQLAYHYAKQGNWQKGEELLSNEIKSMDPTELQYWNVYKSRTGLLAYVDSEQALKLIDKALESKTELSAELTEIKANILINREKYQQALDTINKTEDMGFTSNHLARQRRNLESWQEGEELHKVSGRFVKSDGDPVSFATVYLRYPDNINHSIRHEEEIHYAVTDANGEFTISGVPNGDYQMYIGIDINQLNGYKWPVEMDDWIRVDGDETKDVTLQPLIEIQQPGDYQVIENNEITFEWEPVEGAAYYRLGFGIEYENGGGSSSPMEQRFTDTQVTLPVEQMYSLGSGVMYGTNEDNELVLIPESILAFANPNGDFYWYVEAFTDDGDLITASNGYRLSKDTMGKVPYFQLKERQLTNADQQLLEGNLDEALNQYKQVLEKEPNNLHALRMIEKIILFGEREDISFEEARTEALPYTEKLAELTKDYNGTDYLFNLALEAFEQGEWNDFFNYYHKYEEMLVGGVPDYSKGKYAIALMKNGQFEEAEQAFQELMDSDGSNRFMPAWTALRLYTTNDFTNAAKIAEEYRELSFYDDRTIWKNLIYSISKKTTENGEVKQQFEAGLDLYMTGNEGEMDQWLEQQPSGSVKKYFEKLNEL